jgi:Spy/CpxP family protein refolding chaperone
MEKTIIMGLGVALGLAILVATPMTWGFGFYSGSGMGPDLSLPILGEKQFHKVDVLQRAFLKESEPLKHDLLTKRTEVGILGLSPNPDPAALKTKEKEIRDLQAKLQEKAENLRFEIWKILNLEQRAHFDVGGPGTGFNSHMGWRLTSR